jgi:serine protease
MAAEAAKAATSVFHDYSANASYVIAMPSGIKPSGFGSQYCAYHTTTSANGSRIAWTNLPYMPDAGGACGAYSVSAVTDGVTIVAGHEQAETETDPQPNTGWLDTSGQEIGDKCAWINLIDNSAAGGYATQPLWSNATSSCVQTYPQIVSQRRHLCEKRNGRADASRNVDYAYAAVGRSSTFSHPGLRRSNSSKAWIASLIGSCCSMT